MNDYDDLDDSSENSFRARSNTWPLNRLDFGLPSSAAQIDETLPEIELEDDDLFTTNENWSTGVIDHDIMSWDPILNSTPSQQQPQPHPQPQQQQQQQQQSHQQQHQQQQPHKQHSQHTQETATQPSTIHHRHHQQPQPQNQTQAQHQTATRHQLPPPTSSAATPHQQTGHQRLPSVHLLLDHRQQQQQQAATHQHQHQHHHLQPIQATTVICQDPQHLQHHQQPQHHPHHQRTHHQQSSESFIEVAGSQSNIVSSQNAASLHHQPPQLQHQTSPQPSAQHIQSQHQTLNSVHCLDAEDSNEYHLEQLHHLHLDNPPLTAVGDGQQDQFAPTLTSLCVHNTPSNLNNDSYNISPNQNHHQHHHHNLQPLTSARYDLDSHVGLSGGEYDVKPSIDETLGHQHGHLHQQPHLHHDQQLVHHPHQQLHHHHHHHLEQQTHHHHPHHTHQIQQTHHTIHSHLSSSLDNQSSGSLMLSSSLGTSGIGLSADLEDLDYKPDSDPTNLLHQNSHYDGEQQSRLTSEQQPQVSIESQSHDGAANDTKQSDSSSSTKIAKQNVPRRNAWGNMSYADLISQAINSTSDKRLTLSQIYDWMVQHVPYFKDKGDSNSSAGWKNSVRHNLSLHSRFKRLQNEGTGKSSWWTINPEANVGKCARRRAASMEASKYEKKRGRAKKKAEAIRQGLISYPSLTNSSLNGSTSTLEQQPSKAKLLSKFQLQQLQQQPDEQAEQESLEQQNQIQHLEQMVMPPHRPQVQIQTLDQYGMDRPSQQQQQHLQLLQQSDARSIEELTQQQTRQSEQNLFSAAPQQQQQRQTVPQLHHQEQPRYEENNENSKLQQQQQQQQSQYYYQFELSTAL